MEIESYNDIKIPRPRQDTELEIRYQSEAHLRQKFPTGEYTKEKDINCILQWQFKFYSDLLSALVNKIASRDLLEFFLYYFDQASEIQQFYKARSLGEDEVEKWKDLGPVLRRALKYLAERTVIIDRYESDQNGLSKEFFVESLEKSLEKSIICAEELVKLYMASDASHSIFPDGSKLTILPIGEKDYFLLETFKGGLNFIDINQKFWQRVEHDFRNRNRFIQSDLLFDSNEQNKFVGQAFKKTIGISYREILEVIADIIRFSQLPSGGIPFIHRGNLLRLSSQQYNLSENVIEKIIAGFSINRQQMELEKRQIWLPAQEYRLLRRGFFEFPHSTGIHLIFSKNLAEESLTNLVHDLVFAKLPDEWDNPFTRKAIDQLSNHAGKWFESVVEENLKTCLGFSGIKSVKSIQNIQGDVIAIPSAIGEIDYIGYSKKDKLILVIECKLVSGKAEPRFIRNDISKFVTNRKSYLSKFRKKFNWVQENHQMISSALLPQQSGSSEYPNRVAGIILTFFPTMASYWIDDYPCVSLTEFMLDYESIGEYPYQIGIHSLKF